MKAAPGGRRGRGRARGRPDRGATNECRGLNPCVPIAGPWVVVPGEGRGAVPAHLPEGLRRRRHRRGAHRPADRPLVPRLVREPGRPGRDHLPDGRVRRLVRRREAPRPRPSGRTSAASPPTGGGPRTPTGVRKITPPGHPTTRRVVTRRVAVEDSIVVTCKADERLVALAPRARVRDARAARPGARLEPRRPRPRVPGSRSSSTSGARRGQGIVQVAAVCAGGAMTFGHPLAAALAAACCRSRSRSTSGSTAARSGTR